MEPDFSCCALWVAAPPFGSDWLDFMPDEPSWLAAPPEGDADGEDGALCCALAPPAAPPSRPPPMPCALARPVPAINAAVATVIISRLLIEFLLTKFALPSRQRKGIGDVPSFSLFHRF